MKPAAYVPPMQYPEHTAPDDVPAFVAEIPQVRIARLWHKDGPLHENARLAAERYTKRGWRVEPVLDKKQLVIAGSVKVPTRKAA